MKNIIIMPDGEQIEIERADTFIKRLKGLMFRRGCPSKFAMLFYPCKRVHTCFMKFDIDVVYLSNGYMVISREHTVLSKETLKPWKLGQKVKGTGKVLEGPAGFADNLKPGDVLTLTSMVDFNK
mgnify:CR=1 FL=1